jgi:HD superfamily phosphodiesterase
MNYVKTKSMEYKIDNSHNYKHSLDVLKRGKLLMENKGKNYNEISRSIIYLGCILHDMCDHKYMDEKTEMNNILNSIDYQQSNCRMVYLIYGLQRDRSKLQVKSDRNY